MERPTDSYKETHNIVLANEDTYFGGQVSNLQVAELMAFMAKHRRLSFCKIVEVVAETTAPLTSIKELLAKIPPKQELPAEPKPDPIPLNVESEPIVSAVKKELKDAQVPKAPSQSLFTMYADLKPPTSPTPTPSMGPAISKPKIEDPLQTNLEPTTSYAEKEQRYADLKPPTSPTPTPSTGPSSSKQTFEEIIQTKSEHTTSNADEETAKTSLKAEHLSPYIVYDDLKPPTSPSSIAPSAGSFIPTSSSMDKSNHIEQQMPRPLSPYTMYEDLKPPSSTLPSAPK